MKPGNILYSRLGSLAVLKFVGKLGFAEAGSRHLSSSLNAFLDQLFEMRNFENILLDLTEAESIDSTNLGLMARITKFCMQQFNRKAVIVTMNENTNRLLESVGFDKVFVVVHKAVAPCTEMTAIPVVNQTDPEWAQTVLSAHRELCEMNEKNNDTFRGVVELLEEATLP